MISVDKTEVFKNKAEWFEKLFGFKEIPETVQSKFTISTDENGDSFLISQGFEIFRLHTDARWR